MELTKRKLVAVIILVASIFSLLTALGILKEQEKLRKNVDIERELENIKTQLGTGNIKESGNLLKFSNEINNIVCEKVLSQFFYFINKKEFDKAYAMLDEDYKKLFDVNEMLFKARYDFDNEKIYQINNIQRLNARTVLDVSIFNQKDLEEYKGSIPVSRKIFSVTDDHKLDDIGIKRIEDINKKESQANIEINILRK